MTIGSGRRGLGGVAVLLVVVLAGAVAGPAAAWSDERCTVSDLGHVWSGGWTSDVAVSADGSTVAIVDLDDRFDQRLVIRDLASGEETVIEVPDDYYGLESPSLSADGSVVAYVATSEWCARGGCVPILDTFVRDLDTGATTMITPKATSAAPALSADGTALVYAAGDEDWIPYSVVWRDLETGEEQVVVEHDDDLWLSPPSSISPDGSLVAFREGAFDGWVRVYDTATRELLPPLHEPRYRSWEPRFLADGVRVVYQSEDLGGDPDHSGTFVHDLSTGTTVALRDLGPEGLLAGNGTRVAFGASTNLDGGNPDGNRELFAYDIATRAITQLTDTTEAGWTAPAAVSSDGGVIAFLGAREDDDRYVVAVATTCFPPPRPDAHVAAAATRRYVGDDQFAVRASPAQRRDRSIPAGASRSFLVRLQNDRSTSDTLTVMVQEGGAAGFTVRYRLGPSDVTAEVAAGTFTTGSLAAGEAAVLQVKITAGDDVAPGARHRVDLTARSATNPVAADTVRARVTVPTGATVAPTS